MRKTLSILLISSLLLLMCAQEDERAIIENVEKRLESVNSYRIVGRINWSVGNESGSFEFRMYFVKPDRMRLEQNSSVIVVNGSERWMCDDRHVFHSNRGEDEAVDFFTHYLELMKRQEGRVSGYETVLGRNCVVIEFEKENTAEWVERVWVDRNEWDIVRAEVGAVLETPAGNVTAKQTVEVLEVEFNPDLSPSLFMPCGDARKAIYLS
ncbi:LolA family protein [Geoglobus ahangari]